MAAQALDILLMMVHWLWLCKSSDTGLYHSQWSGLLTNHQCLWVRSNYSLLWVTVTPGTVCKQGRSTPWCEWSSQIFSFIHHWLQDDDALQFHSTTQLTKGLLTLPVARGSCRCLFVQRLWLHSIYFHLPSLRLLCFTLSLYMLSYSVLKE